MSFFKEKNLDYRVKRRWGLALRPNTRYCCGFQIETFRMLFAFGIGDLGFMTSLRLRLYPDRDGSYIASSENPCLI